MAIQINGAAALTVTMTDAEFLRVNGTAAPTINQGSPFYGLGLTAASATGTTTLTMAVGSKVLRNIEQLLRVLRRIAPAYSITYTP